MLFTGHCVGALRSRESSGIRKNCFTPRATLRNCMTLRTSMIPNFTKALILLILFGSSTKPVVTQTLTSATIVGTVSDSSGAFVPHATVRITQADTEVVRTTTTGDAGDYRFPFLKPGDYTVEVDGGGLNSATIHVQLLVGKEESVSITLGVQSVQQSIDVTTASTLLQAENGNQVTS